VKIMIDTNVIIDVYQNRMPFVDNSMKVLKLSESRKVAGYITASAITDIYYILNRHIKDRQQLMILVKKLLTSVTLVDVLAKDVSDSFELAVDDFEDALLVQCATRLKTDYIVTRNIKDFVNLPVPPITPDDLLNKFFNSK